MESGTGSCRLWSKFGLAINTTSLGGLAIVIRELVDDALIDLETVIRRLRENAAEPEQERDSVLNVIYLLLAFDGDVLMLWALTQVGVLLNVVSQTDRNRDDTPDLLAIVSNGPIG